MQQSNSGMDVDTYWSLVRVCVITVVVCPQEWLSLQNKAI